MCRSTVYPLYPVKPLDKTQIVPDQDIYLKKRTETWLVRHTDWNAGPRYLVPDFLSILLVNIQVGNVIVHAC